jgi:hypothetical protein
MENPSTALVQQNSTILSNVAALTGCIVAQIAGKDISRSLSGVPLTRDQIENMVLSKVTASLVAEQAATPSTFV